MGVGAGASIPLLARSSIAHIPPSLCHSHLSGYDLKKLLKAFKKEFACNGTLVDDEELGQVIQLQGDQRQKVSSFL